MTFWVMIGTLTWDGEKSDDTEFAFPLNIVAALFQGSSRDVQSKTADTGLKKEYFQGINYKEAEFSEKDGLHGHLPYPGNFISQISINGLYNFLTKPSTAAGNLFLSAGFVSISSPF